MSKILIIDDDPTVRCILTNTLEKEGYTISLASNGAEGLAQAESIHPDLIICDWIMPHLTGLEVCRQIKTNPELSFIYFILLTIREDISDRITGLDMGADEYLWKPVDLNELRARVRAGLRLQRLTQKLKAANHALSQANQKLVARNELLESLSLTDPLTGLLNRRALDQGLPHILRQVGTREQPTRYRYLCLLMLDVDYFKRVNDQHGHGVGDAVLQAVAGRLQTHARPGSLLYRYGGEEFLCVTPGLNPGASREYGQLFCETIADHPIKISQDVVLQVTVSVGGAIACEQNLADSQALLGQADQALYQAKQTGRNRVCMFD